MNIQYFWRNRLPIPLFWLSYYYGSVILVIQTHTITSKTARSGMIHLGPNIVFSPIFLCYPYPKTHIDSPPPKKDRNK